MILSESELRMRLRQAMIHGAMLGARTSYDSLGDTLFDAGGLECAREKVKEDMLSATSAKIAAVAIKLGVDPVERDGWDDWEDETDWNEVFK